MPLRFSTSSSHTTTQFIAFLRSPRAGRAPLIALFALSLVLALTASMATTTPAAAVSSTSSSGSSLSGPARELPEKAPTAPAASSIASTLSTPMWATGYNTGTLRDFQSTPWNNVPYRPAVTATPVFEGRYAGKYVIPRFGKRSENVPRVRSFVGGDNLWFSTAIRLGSDFSTTTSKWQVLLQFKNDGTGSPPVELVVTRGYFRIEGGYGWPGNTSAIHPRFASRAVAPARRGVWYRFIFHIQFSSNSRIGYVSVWVNGVQKMKTWHMPGGTLYPRLRSYLKVGYYRDPSISIRSTVYQDRIKVGHTMASVV